ncbi:PfaD family polyunsaturated fatty acid/polyketide biosynthesis protein [Arhodomonas sp. AD133]|uniref:PfaD family polyunsaturated fatty acid/polyketide biosynthesis protein n=1 Tax=Arhodomonas sp. AD133 TaxID=3415009 RepID=UPI003EBE682F
MSAHLRMEPEGLGASAFRERYGLRYAYVSGAMYKGIATAELVIAMGQAGFMGFCGTGGVALSRVERSIEHIQRQLGSDGAYGMNLLNNVVQPELEEETVDLYLKHEVPVVEASAYMTVSPALARYRLKGLYRGADGQIVTPHRVVAKISRPEVAEAFMRPVDERTVHRLREAGKITKAEAELARFVPVADDICVEADSGGHTDRGRLFALLPGILALRERMMAENGFARPIHVGAAGGIGTPTAAAAAFVLGADFVTTGSINQCTVEAGISDTVKDMLQQMDVQDTDYAPAGDMFEIGARVQVLRKGVLFPGRANKLYELYSRHDSLEEIDARMREQIETKYFKRSFEDVWAETRAHYARTAPDVLEKAERSAKMKMALVFRWYFVHTTRLALEGDSAHKADFQVHCGPALGAFNQWVRGTELESWRNRRAPELGTRIMQAAAAHLNRLYSTPSRAQPQQVAAV